jgi:hypothetical protein
MVNTKECNMIVKSDLKVDQRLHHRILGEVIFTDDCKALEETHGVPDSLFVSERGEVIEVTLSLLSTSR